ncbi:hypothetical protein ACA910_007643 [Epithemia clementina (nom. ined.)]
MAPCDSPTSQNEQQQQQKQNRRLGNSFSQAQKPGGPSKILLHCRRLLVIGFLVGFVTLIGNACLTTSTTRTMTSSASAVASLWTPQQKRSVQASSSSSSSFLGMDTSFLELVISPIRSSIFKQRTNSTTTTTGKDAIASESQSSTSTSRNATDQTKPTPNTSTATTKEDTAVASTTAASKVIVTNSDTVVVVSSSMDTIDSPTPTTSRPRRPHFVLHVGPGKTGTTSIQCALQTHKNMLANEKEGYTVYYTESCNTPLPGYEQPSPLLYLCLREDLEENDENNEMALPACMKEYFRQWKTIGASSSSSSIIVSDEHLFNTPPQRYNALLQLLSEDFDVTVISFYRNFVESAVSHYAQRFKRVLQQKVWPLLTSDHEDNERASAAAALPDFVTFVPLEAAQFFSTNTDDNNSVTMVPRDLYKRMANEGANPSNVEFRLLNFEEKSMDIVTQFICYGLRQATKTCLELQSQAPLPRKNVRNVETHVVDSVAVAVYRQGLLPAAHQDKQRRSEVIRVLYKHVLEPYLTRSSPLPSSTATNNRDTSITPSTLAVASTLWMQQQAPLLWTCPTQDQWASIRDATLAKARSAFDHFEKNKNIDNNNYILNKNREEWLQQELQHVNKAAQSGLLCHLNGDGLLASDTWRKAIVNTLSSTLY